MHKRVGLLLSLLILLAVPAVANAQAGEGTLRIEQQGPDGGTITGGCYRAASEDDLRERCDVDDGATDGVIVLENLLPGEFGVRETNPPAGYRAGADFTVTVGGGTITRERRHEATPRLRVVTTDAGGRPKAGSCWLIRTPGETEGYVDRCDADDGADDGTTTFLDVAAGAYELQHLHAPAGIDRIDDTPFTMRDEDTTLTFALESAVAPENTAPPTVGGGHAVGDELTGGTGTWTGSATITFSDAWERCNLDGTGCTPTPDHDAHYTLGAEDAGLALRYRVTATNDGGKRTAVSALHAVSALRAPEFTTPPSVSGSTTLGQKLTASPGTWTDEPAFTYQWQRCGATCTDIAGATAATYATTKSDAELRVRVVVTATNAAGHATIASEQTEPIDDDPYVAERPSTSGTPQPGEVMTAYPGHWISHYGNLQFDYRWLRCAGSDCEAVGYGDTYTITYADEGASILVEVTATDAGGFGRARSNPRTVVTMRPINVSPPAFTGKQRLGERLTGQFGVWTSPDGSPIHSSFSWQRCEADGTQCVTIPGQPTSGLGVGRYTITLDDIGRRLRVQVGASNDSGVRYAYSGLTDVLALHPPVAATQPGFNGRARLGMALQGYTGRWTYDGLGPVHVAFSWQRCDADGTQCTTIAGSDARYTITEDDLGHRLRLQVAAETIEGTTYAYSPLTELIERHPPIATAPPTFTGTARLGQTLIGRNGSWAYDGAGPTHITFSWQRCAADGTQCATIPGQPTSGLYTNRYTIVAADLGHRLRLQVGSETPDGTTYAYTSLTDVVA